MIKTVAILVPDGVGIKNYLYTSLLSKIKKEAKVIIIHNVSDDVLEQVEKTHQCSFLSYRMPSYNETLFQRVLRELIKYSRLRYNAKITANNTILTNWSLPKKLKGKLIYKCLELYSKLFINDYTSIQKLERKYQKLLLKSIPDFKKFLEDKEIDSILCTNQRAVLAVPLMLAAKTMKIKTYTAIFSWDNLPKGNLTIRSDKYILWSNYMKNEMNMYYPEISEEDLLVTGTPQFEFYSDNKGFLSKEVFYDQLGLDIGKKTICFSGDDLRTSPYDELYLEHLAEAIMNSDLKDKVQIIFRRCPVDLSDRYDYVIEKYKNIIKKSDPIWSFTDKKWFTIYPKYDDVFLLKNIILHSDAVINIGSTMAHDYAIFNKPAIYINYNIKKNTNWSVDKVYGYQHFRSMKELQPVYWLNDKSYIYEVIKKSIYNESTKVMKDSQDWLKTICVCREEASENISKILIGE